jgi:hypothetical protein
MLDKKTLKFLNSISETTIYPSYKPSKRKSTLAWKDTGYLPHHEQPNHISDKTFEPNPEKIIHFITQEDIDYCSDEIWGKQRPCPVIRSLRKIYKKYVFVNKFLIHIGVMRYDTPKNVEEFLTRFDGGYPVKPIDFRLFGGRI